LNDTQHQLPAPRKPPAPRALRCPLCGGRSAPFIASTRKTSSRYYLCGICGFIALAPGERPTASAAKARYLLHDNDPEDPGYRKFVSDFASQAIIPYIAPGARILDFGSGPRPLLAELLSERGFACDIYDPNFARTRAWRRRTYEAVALHEVAEHLADPGATLGLLAERVAPCGILALRSRFPPGQRQDFAQWWYRMDPTHISFYTPDSLERFFAGRAFALAFFKEPDTIVFRKIGVSWHQKTDSRFASFEGSQWL
jgi:hypothetical protein